LAGSNKALSQPPCETAGLRLVLEEVN